MAEPREFSNLTRHAIFHAVSEIAPQSFHSILPASGSHKIEGFCHDLSELFRRTILENPLLTSEEVHRFYERATSVEDFTMLIEKRTLTVTEGALEEEPIHRLCWTYYEAERKGDVTYPKWLSQESTYGLWLIFNCVLDKELTTRLPQVSVNEVLQRMLELCGYTWDESYGYSKEEALGFPDFLDVVTDLFDDLRLEMSLTSEVIADLVDEIVHDVLRKGYLTKKGHVRKNYKRRWFVLQRTTLRYYQSREKMQLKGKLVLNSNTDVRSIPDKGTRRYRFEVTCGETGTLLEILADDQRMKQNWMLAIKKAIALAKVLEGDDTTTQDEVSKRLAGFYRLKYGTSQPTLFHQDSEVQRIKQRASLHRSLENLLDTKPREKKKKRHQRHFSCNSLEAEGIPDRYIKMQPTLFQDMDSTREKLLQLQDRSSGEESSEIDDEGYLKMNHLNSVALSESNFGSPGSTLSPPFLSDDYPPASLPASFTFESPTTDTKRSLEDLMPCSMREKCGNLGPIDEELAPQPDIDKGEEYELCDPSFPRYVPKSSSPVANGTYVDFTREQYTVADPLPPSKEDHEVAKLTDDKLSLDPPAEELEASHDKSSANEYLTLLPPSSVSSLIPPRSNTNGPTESPPVPTPRKGTSPIHNPALKKEKPPIIPRAARASTPERSKVTRDVPPLPPPHAKLHWQTSSPVLPTVPTRHIPRLSSPSDPFSEVYSKEQRRRSRSPTPVSPTSSTSPSHSDRFSQSTSRDVRTLPPLPPRT